MNKTLRPCTVNIIELVFVRIWKDCPVTEIYWLQDILDLEDKLNEHISDRMVKKQGETDLDTESPEQLKGKV